MDRRSLLKAAGAGLAVGAGSVGIVNATRADVALKPEVVRGGGEPMRIELENLDGETLRANVSGSDGRTLETTRAAFQGSPRDEAASVATGAMIPELRRRIDHDDPCLMTGRGGNPFGWYVHVWQTRSDHCEPKIDNRRFVDLTPRTVVVSAIVDDRTSTVRVPVAVERGVENVELA